MELKIDIDDFRFRSESKRHLTDWPTRVPDFYKDNGDYKDALESYREEIAELQNMMYAHDKHAFLLIFQGMDTGGKDGAIKHVMSGINPSGVSVASFKKPSELDLEHDWMWRCQSHFPERGRIAIFNRSYYEEVLVVKVHPEILKKGQRIPSEHLGDLDEVWKQRYSDIRNLEDYLHRNGTQVVKFFFHLGKEEQKSRLLERINEPEKNWKMSIQDVAERQHWDAYMDAYHDALTATHTSNSPWYVVPADDKKNARLIVSSILLNHIRKLKMDYPEVSPEFRKEMQEAKRMLESE